MKQPLPRWTLSVGSVALAAALAALAPALLRGRVARAGDDAPADPALERTREQVKMLDDLYKNAVVSITARYVGQKDADPAIKVAKDIFGAMKKRGWHSARLVDATGEPLDDLNAPKTDFEKDAAEAILSGKPYVDRVVGEGKDRRLLAATVVPAVMPKCIECHTHVKVGEVLGFIRYDVPIK